SSPLQISTPAGALSAPSGHGAPFDRAAAKVSAIVVLPVPGAPASRWNLPRASQCGHSQRVASGEKAVAGNSSTCGVSGDNVAWAPGAGANSTKRTAPAGPANSCSIRPLLRLGNGNAGARPAALRGAIQRLRACGRAEEGAHAFERVAGFVPVENHG